MRRDHPRSRGVYTGKRRPSWSASGSSPLARGLREVRAPATQVGRIIPARAGFTRPGSRATVRSRGSSPLARGLPRVRPATPTTIGIIPARAGFTGAGGSTWRLIWDHPRSRGVYKAIPGGNVEVTGSSPLARGLPEAGQGAQRTPGIIPARAGFTRGYDGLAFSHWDHPRSRGVYQFTYQNPEGGLGSSPLARGLPLLTVTRGDETRIIPARAGFTPRSNRIGRCRGDHPRSRGVYCFEICHLCF